jgi:hypothetical protein
MDNINKKKKNPTKVPICVIYSRTVILQARELMMGEPNQGKHPKLNKKANIRFKLQLEGIMATRDIRIR